MQHSYTLGHVLKLAGFYSIQSVYTQHYQDSTHIWVSRWPLDDCLTSSEDRSTFKHNLHEAGRNIPATVSTF